MHAAIPAPALAGILDRGGFTGPVHDLGYVFTTLIQHPASPVRNAISSELLRRALTGLAMGMTAIALIYSPWGRQSGAHVNPAVTLTFLRLGKVKPWDAAFYIYSQFLRGLAGVTLISALLRDLFRQPPVEYVATCPGPEGPALAFLAFVVDF